MAGAASSTTDSEDHNGQTVQTVLLRPRKSSSCPRLPAKSRYEDGTRQPGPVEAPLVTCRRLPSRIFSPNS